MLWGWWFSRNGPTAAQIRHLRCVMAMPVQEEAFSIPAQAAAPCLFQEKGNGPDLPVVEAAGWTLASNAFTDQPNP